MSRTEEPGRRRAPSSPALTRRLRSTTGRQARAGGAAGLVLWRPRESSGCCPLHYRHASSRYTTVHLAFDICQGLGIALAMGIRPFIPALAVGALASGGVQIHFAGTDYSFLQSTGFLLAVVLCAVAVAI